MFIAEKFGEVRVVQPGAGVSTRLVDSQACVNEDGERGLEGIAVDKDFSASGGFIYLAYTAEVQPLMPDGDGPMVSRVTRITVRADGAVASPTAPVETVILGKRDPMSGPCPAPADNAVDWMGFRNPCRFHLRPGGGLTIGDNVATSAWEASSCSATPQRASAAGAGSSGAAWTTWRCTGAP